jgi:hypothetical protein
MIPANRLSRDVRYSIAAALACRVFRRLLALNL